MPLSEKKKIYVQGINKARPKLSVYQENLRAAEEHAPWDTYAAKLRVPSRSAVEESMRLSKKYKLPLEETVPQLVKKKKNIGPSWSK